MLKSNTDNNIKNTKTIKAIKTTKTAKAIQTVKTVKTTKTVKTAKINKIYRPTFFMDTEKTQEIRAGGVLFYKYNEDKTDCELLLIKTRYHYEDFGGCTDAEDNNILETVTREVQEESNGIFCKEDVYEKIKNSNPIYIARSKYVLYFMELDKRYDVSLFGEKEFHDDIYRTVEWIPYDTFTDNNFINKLNFRLRAHNVLEYLAEKININS